MRILGISILTAGIALAQPAQPARSAPTKRPSVALPAVTPAGRASLTAGAATITALEAELASLRASLSESHPDVLAVRAKVAQARAQQDQLQAQLRYSYAVATPRLASPAIASPTGSLPDNWWRNAAMVNLIGLTPAQVKQMEDVFQQYRLKLIDLNASLEKEEVTMEPLVAAETLDEGRLTTQIDRVSQARAELEKTRGRMLLGIRKVLEPEQWRKLSDTGYANR